MKPMRGWENFTQCHIEGWRKNDAKTMLGKLEIYEARIKPLPACMKQSNLKPDSFPIHICI